jgi:hypothetical protein
MLSNLQSDGILSGLTLGARLHHLHLNLRLTLRDDL